MKKLLLPLLAVLLSSTLFIACSKSDSSTPAQSMTATINGTAFKASTTTAATSSSGGITELYIIGDEASTSKTIQVGIYNYTSTTGVGTYTIGGSGTSTGIATYTTGSGGTNGASGQVVISSINGKTITGTFNIVTYDSTTITNGAFSAQLP